MAHWGRTTRRLIGATSLAAALAVGVAVQTSPLLAEPLPQSPGPSVTVSPAQVGAGDAVRVSVSGLVGLPATGTNLCIGFLGPGNNLELGLSPSFRSRLGTLAISAAGVGQAEVRVPVQASAGVYRIRVGGCPPQPDLAPLAAIAEAQLAVTRVGPTGLPSTGGALHAQTLTGVTLAALATLCGVAARCIRRGVSSGVPKSSPSAGA